ncbi:MAG: Ig-like domain-containing protein [Holophagales bacterium]|jgi:uncharacterized protein YjdB|nr:Ig-like domain-containing protein [Holophagales bacterium]
MKKHFYLLIAAVMALLFSFTACGGDDVSVTGLTLDKTVISVNAGSTERLTANVHPTNAKNKNVSWASGDVSVATVTDGNVSGLKAGQAIITVTTEDGSHAAKCTVTVTTPSATDMALNKNAMSLAAGAEERLIATVTPAAADQTVVWASSNHAVATVARDGDGVVIAGITGTATITAATADGRFTATCAVTVTPNIITPTGVTVVPSSLTLLEDSSEQLTAVVTPPNIPPTNPPTTIIWSVSNPDKASVSATGRVTAIAAGDVDIIASYGSGENAPKGICALIVTEPIRVTAVNVTPTAETITAGQSIQLTATLTPSKPTYPGVTWSSDDTSVATVSATDMTATVTGQKAGIARITVTSIDGGHSATCTVTVNPAPVTGVLVSPANAEVLLNGTLRLIATVLPAYAENKGVAWRSDNPAIARVDETTGVVTGVSLGQTIITATTIEGGFHASCTVSVVTELSPGNVYIAGYLNYYGFLLFPWWGKNGETYFLSDMSLRDPFMGQTHSIFVADDGSKYVAGWHNNNTRNLNAAIWKDPSGPYDYQLLANPSGNDDSEAASIFVSGNDVYVAGYVGGLYDFMAPYVWINNVPAPLPVSNLMGRASSITVSGGVVYVSGAEADIDGNGKAVIWKDGARTSLHPAGAHSSWAAIVSVGDSAYASGYVIYDPNDFPRPTLWKDGVLVDLPLPANAMEGIAESVFATMDGKVYAAGYAGYVFDGAKRYAAVLWENGVPRELYPPGANLDSQAFSVYVYGNDVYVSGYVENNRVWEIVVWKNGVPQTFSNPPDFSTGHYPASVFVSPR